MQLYVLTKLLKDYDDEKEMWRKLFKVDSDDFKKLRDIHLSLQRLGWTELKDIPNETYVAIMNIANNPTKLKDPGHLLLIQLVKNEKLILEFHEEIASSGNTSNSTSSSSSPVTIDSHTATPNLSREQRRPIYLTSGRSPTYAPIHVRSSDAELLRTMSIHSAPIPNCVSQRRGRGTLIASDSQIDGVFNLDEVEQPVFGTPNTSRGQM